MNHPHLLSAKRIIHFLLLTFTLSWGFELLVARTRGQPAYLHTGMHPLGMFFPAFAALFLQIFCYRDSPIYFRTHRSPLRWLFSAYFLLVLLYTGLTLLVLLTPIRSDLVQGVGSLLVMLWTLSLFYIYGKTGAANFQQAGLQLGDKTLSVRFIAALVVFLLIQAGLNALFGLGTFPGVQETVGGIKIPHGIYPPAVILFFGISVIGTPLSVLAVLFGEEYGWRGFLQTELTKLGMRRGVLLTGLVWGVWHFAVILSGVHTYPPSALGLGLGLVFFILTGFVFGYAVIKTGSIWTAVFMHGVMNSLYAFILTYLMRPGDKILSFGLGVFGLVCLAGGVALLLRDPLWKVTPSDPGSA